MFLSKMFIHVSLFSKPWMKPGVQGFKVRERNAEKVWSWICNEKELTLVCLLCKMFQQKTSFASKCLRKSLALHPNGLNKSISLHPKFLNKSILLDQKCLNKCYPTLHAGIVGHIVCGFDDMQCQALYGYGQWILQKIYRQIGRYVFWRGKVGEPTICWSI